MDIISPPGSKICLIAKAVKNETKPVPFPATIA